MSALARLVLAVAIGLAVGALGTWRVQEWRWTANTQKADNLRLQKAQEAERENRNIESARQRNVVEAQNAAVNRGIQLQVAAGAARSESERLRNDLDAITADLPRRTDAAVRQYAAAANAVLDQCQRAFVDLAGKADGHASDALTLQQAWPK